MEKAKRTIILFTNIYEMGFEHTVVISGTDSFAE